MTTFRVKPEKVGASHAECGQRRRTVSQPRGVEVVALPLLCALHGLIHQILSYIHQFNTSAAPWCGLELDAVLMRDQLYSSLLDEPEAPGLPAEQESPPPGPVAQGLRSPRCTPSAEAFCIMWGFLNYCPDGGSD